VAKNHVIDPNNHDYWSDCEYDVTPQVMDYDPLELPFVGEDCIDTLLPKTNEYKEKLVKYQGKDPRSIKILKKDEGKKDQEQEQAIKNIVKEDPPTQPYIEDVPHFEFGEGSLALMWDKRKGKPKYDKKSEIIWLGPYIVKKKSKKGTYYLSSMDGRKIPLPS
jgi:hypothetical protein